MVRSTDHRKLRDPMLAVWWLGQSTFLLRWKGRFVLLDPCLSRNISAETPSSADWCSQRLDPLFSPKRLGFVDVVACSCDRPGHLDPDTLRALVEVNPSLRVVCRQPIRNWCGTRQVSPRIRSLALS